ncbi:MAG: hypothetical protein CVU78_01195 [Elusimicrobia bacterium HGW-Elusimicrobia-2]|nr:MAG: hypothetical protein CVU78_01195 [Elusimicrobia bacterium HGW-Elusimicrobia-2]
MFEAGLIFSTFVLCFFIRLSPFPAQGCDAYYFLLCAERFKKDKQIPIILPNYYMLENNEQWYPPGFSIFLALFSQKFLEKCHWLLSPLLDSIIGLILMFVLYALTGDVAAAVIAGLIYAFAWGAISQTENMTSRQLGVLFLNLAVILLFISLETFPFIAFYFIAVLLLLTTHKLNSQNFYITLPLLAIISDMRILALYIAGLVIVLIATKGFYWKILKAHWDIVKFWSSNWPFLGAHQIKHSPVYGNPDDYNNEIYSPANIIKYVASIILANPLFIIVAISFFTLNSLGSSAIDSYRVWLLLTYALLFMLIVFPFLRGIGEGYKYVAGAVPATAFIAGYLFHAGHYRGIILMLFVVSLFWSFFKYYKIFQNQRVPPAGGRPRMQGAINYINELKTSDNISLLCVPLHLSDIIAYNCRIKILWGSHNHPFEMIKSIFPVFKKKISELKKEYGINYLLLDKKYADSGFFEKELKQEVFSEGDYSIYRI